MYEFLKINESESELYKGLDKNSIKVLNKLLKKEFKIEIPNDYKDFLMEFNGYYINGFTIFGFYNKEQIEKEANLESSNLIEFNIRYIDYTDITDYLFIGKTSTDFLVYNIKEKKYEVLSNGTLDSFFESDNLFDCFKEIYELTTDDIIDFKNNGENIEKSTSFNHKKYSFLNIFRKK